MAFAQEHLLSAIVFLPLLSALVVLAFPRDRYAGARAFVVVAGLANFVLSLWTWARFDSGVSGLQGVEQPGWIHFLGARSLGVDGLSLLLILLTTLLLPVVILTGGSKLVERTRARMVGLLLVQAGVLGAFLVNPGLVSFVQQLRADAELSPSPDAKQEAARAARTLPPLPGQAGAPQADTHELYQLQRTLPWRAGRPGAPRAGGTP